MSFYLIENVVFIDTPAALVLSSLKNSLKIKNCFIKNIFSGSGNYGVIDVSNGSSVTMEDIVAEKCTDVMEDTPMIKITVTDSHLIEMKRICVLKCAEERDVGMHKAMFLSGTVDIEDTNSTQNCADYDSGISINSNSDSNSIRRLVLKKCCSNVQICFYFCGPKIIIYNFYFGMNDILQDIHSLVYIVSEQKSEIHNSNFIDNVSNRALFGGKCDIFNSYIVHSGTLVIEQCVIKQYANEIWRLDIENPKIIECNQYTIRGISPKNCLVLFVLLAKK